MIKRGKNLKKENTKGPRKKEQKAQRKTMKKRKRKTIQKHSQKTQKKEMTYVENSGNTFSKHRRRVLNWNSNQSKRHRISVYESQRHHCDGMAVSSDTLGKPEH